MDVDVEVVGGMNVEVEVEVEVEVDAGAYFGHSTARSRLLIQYRWISCEVWVHAWVVSVEMHILRLNGALR